MARPRKQDPEVLRAALIGLQRMLDAVEQSLADLRRRLGTQSDSQPATAKRTMSAAARKRIALAQKKRWAAYKAKTEKAAEPKPKRTISAEGRARIAAATKKRWAAVRKAEKASGAKAAAAVPPPPAEAAPATE